MAFPIRISSPMLRNICSNEYLRLGVRSRLLSLLRPLQEEPDQDFQINFRGLVFDGNFRIAQDYYVYYLGCYEAPELLLLQTLSSRIRDCISLDVGCNMGQHALVLTMNSSKVYAFEPFEAVRRVAERRMDANRIRNIEFFPFGLGLKDEKLPYYLDTESQNNATGSFLASHDANAIVQGALQIRQGDAWARSIGLDKLDLIKVDVEGFEADVIGGLRETINTRKPFIMTENTESSALRFREHGGLRAMLDFPYDLFLISRFEPKLVFFQDPRTRLLPVALGEELEHGDASRNLLIAPRERRALIEDLIS
jgi:FkbM family methyltransferase